MKNTYRKLYKLLKELDDVERNIGYNEYLAKKFNVKYREENKELIIIQNNLLKDIEKTIQEDKERVDK